MYIHLLVGYRWYGSHGNRVAYFPVYIITETGPGDTDQEIATEQTRTQLIAGSATKKPSVRAVHGRYIIILTYLKVYSPKN